MISDDLYELAKRNLPAAFLIQNVECLSGQYALKLSLIIEREKLLTTELEKSRYPVFVIKDWARLMAWQINEEARKLYDQVDHEIKYEPM
jgi:hypothetical protein